MKPGSVCECVDAGFGPNYVPEIKRLTRNRIYTIRWLKDNVWCGDDGFITLVGLEEVVNPGCPGWFEMGYDIRRFREIEFPPSLEREIKEVLELVSCE